MKTFTLFILCVFLPSAYSQNWITTTIPARNQLNVIQTTGISISFNRSIIASTLNNNSIKVYGDQRGYYQGVNFSYSNSTRTLTFNLAPPFRVGENVVVTLTSQIRDSANNQMPASFIWGFTVRSTLGVGQFEHFAQLYAGAQPLSMVCQDFERDGDLDLAVCNWQSNNVAVMKNDGAAVFTTTQTIYGVTNPRGFIGGDIDGDTDVDLIAASETNDNIYTIVNDGSGNFAPQNILSGLGGRPIAMSLTDIDGDGDLDLIVGYWDSELVVVFKNNGTGAFTIYSLMNPGIRPLSFAVGDYDSDNDLDLAVGIDWSPPLIAILRNNGIGNLTLSSNYNIQDRPYSIITNDIDADGDLDIVDVNLYSNSLSVLRNTGYGFFTVTFIPTGGEWGSNLAEGDYDADGDIDLLLCNRNSPTISIFTNTGSGLFNLSILSHNDGGAFQLSKGDFDSDGDLDFAVTNFTTYSISIYKNRGSIGITPISNNIPGAFALYQNYPNPFNSGTNIRFDLPLASYAKMILCDLLGREVEVLLDDYLAPGTYSIKWDAGRLASGIYFCSLRAGEFISVKKISLLK